MKRSGEAKLKYGKEKTMNKSAMSHQVEFHAGVHINKAAEILIAAATEHGEAHGIFNEIMLKASPSMTVAEVVADYHQRLDAREVAWRNSPEGQAAERDREERVRASQEKHDLLVRGLASLDFTNDIAVLDWLCAIQDATDHVSVVVRKNEILETFKRHGFEPGANCGDNFKGDDRENVFRYIVGQALGTLQHVAIHGIIHKFAADWKAEFVGAARNDPHVAAGTS